MHRFIHSVSLAALLTTVIPLTASAVPNLIVQNQSSRFERQPLKKQSQHSPSNGSTVLVQPCPDGQKRIIWEQPIYDEQGLFVIGHKKVPICVPENAEPAG